MLNALIGNVDLKDWLIQLLLSLPVVLLALSLHEAAHGKVAARLGDPTARSLGRLTINPLKHLDPIGFVCMLLFGFGWAKPVPIDTRYFKKPRRDMALCALAGPIANLLLALFFAILMRLYFTFLGGRLVSAFWAEILYFVYLFLYYGIRLNVTFAVFNLLPIPPLDGSRILGLFLPPQLHYKMLQYERVISIVLMVVLFLGFLDPVLYFVSDKILSLLWQVVLF